MRGNGIHGGKSRRHRENVQTTHREQSNPDDSANCTTMSPWLVDWFLVFISTKYFWPHWYYWPINNAVSKNGYMMTSYNSMINTWLWKRISWQQIHATKQAGSPFDFRLRKAFRGIRKWEKPAYEWAVFLYIQSNWPVLNIRQGPSRLWSLP